jgi:hypothetical protein
MDVPYHSIATKASAPGIPILAARLFFDGLKAPFDSPGCVDSLRTGYGFYRRPPLEDWM